MSFIWPDMLLLLVAVPLFAVLLVRVQRRRRKMAASFGGLGLMPETAGRGSGQRRHVPLALFLIGLSLLVVALARPQAVVSLPRIEGIVILAFDVSGSMAADDLKPTRMEAAKSAAREFVERQPPSVQIGVVAFSDSAFSVQAPSNDPEAIFAAIGRLAPERGTSLAQGILASLNAIAVDVDRGPRLYSDLTPAPTSTPTPVPQWMVAPAVIVLISDGENNERPDPLEAAQDAANRGVRIYTIGIGSAAGATLQIEGFTVHTQLNEPLLQEISRLTGGAYFNAESEEDLRAIYDNLSPRLVIKPEDMEITSLLAGASVLVMLIGSVLSLLWFGRSP